MRLSLPRGSASYKKYFVLLFAAVIGTASVLRNSHYHRPNIRNHSTTAAQPRYRYLQWEVNNTTTTTPSNGGNSNDDDSISADTVLIALSIFNTIFFVLPTTVRYAWQKRKCLRNPTNVNSNGCICSFPQLQSAISNSNNNNKNDETSVFIICPATTIEFEQPLNITSKRFLLTCGTSRFINTQPCRFIRSSDTSSNNFINYIIGAPTNVTIEDITLYNGYSSSNSSGNTDLVGDGNGGAIHMTGGYLTLQNVIFDSNFATNNGGAIYINTNVQPYLPSGSRHPDAILKIRSRTTFRENRAMNGGGQDIYIVPATVTKSPISLFNITTTNNPIVNVECIPSTLLNRPKFCNYNNDPSTDISTTNRRSIVIENVTTDTEQSKYTNCFNTDVIDTQC
jgi:predicted outer membrane repeat protein